MSRRNRDKRDQLVDELPPDFRDSIERRDAAKDNVAAIVSRRAEFPNELKFLAVRFHFYEGEII